MKRVPVDGLIPTWRLSCGHTVVSPIISSGLNSIRICIPETMPCPECNARTEGLPNSEWSGGDPVPPYPKDRPRPANHPPEDVKS
jgi:hypothetical protein